MSVPVDKIFPPPDPGIYEAVEILQGAGVETYESCQGGVGHSYSEPTVAFHGERYEGFRALSVAMQARLPVTELRRVWRRSASENWPTGSSHVAICATNRLVTRAAW